LSEAKSAIFFGGFVETLSFSKRKGMYNGGRKKAKENSNERN